MMVSARLSRATTVIGPHRRALHPNHTRRDGVSEHSNASISQAPLQKERKSKAERVADLRACVVVNDRGCWLLPHIKPSPNGYIRVAWHGKIYSAHRFMFEFYCRPVQASLELDHLCRNRTCCNPDHLEMVTHQENLRRGINTVAQVRAATTHCPSGHSYADVGYRDKHGARRCRICRRARERQRHAAKKAKKQS